MKKFDLLELVYNHQIQLRYKVSEGGVEENVRTVCDSRDDLTELPKLVQDVAAAFPFCEFENPDGPCCHVDFIRVMGNDQSAIRYNESEYVYENGTEVLKRSVRKPVVVDCLEDLSKHSKKVQKLCNIVFTSEVKAQYIASLPRREIPVLENGKVKTKKKTIQRDDQTTQAVVDGKLTTVVVQKGGEEEIEVPVTQTFIEYKGNLYPEDWDGTLA